MSSANAPLDRHRPWSVWTGTQLVVGGGTNSSRAGRSPLSGAACYTPATDSWVALEAPIAAGAVWTGEQILLRPRDGDLRWPSVEIRPEEY